MMYQTTESNGNLPRNYLQFHENAFVSPLNLINVTHPAPISFGRAPHLLQQTIPRIDPSSLTPSSSLPHLQKIDANKLHMYQFLAQRKLKEDRWKQELNEKNSVKQTNQRRNIRSAQTNQPPKHSKNPSVRSTSVPKKPIASKKEVNRSQMTPPPIHFTRAHDPLTALSMGKQNEINDIHEQLLVQLRTLHNPPARENIIDETEQEKQRRIRLKCERIKRDSRAIYNAHQELKQIIHDIYQSDGNFPRLIHRHLNAYKAILLAVETLANEAPLKPQDAPVQQLFTALLPVLETLNNTNQAFGLSHLHIDSSYFRHPPSKTMQSRSTSDNRSSPSSHLLPSVYQELMKKKQRKPRVIPSVLRPRSAESVRLPRTDTSTISRPTISMQKKSRARSHSPLPSIKSASTIETPFYSTYTVDHILVKLAPRLLANYNGRELTEQIERARTLIPMFLVDNHLTDEDIAGRVIQMLIPRQQQAPPIPTHMEIFETPEERARRVNIDVYHQQISTWEDEMSQIRQRLQNFKTNRFEEETTARRTVKFRVNSPPTTILPENVEIHHPLFEASLDDFVRQSVENKPAFVQSSTRGQIRLQTLDSHKIRQIERYRKDYQSYLNQTESAKSDDFDPCQVINRLSEFLLDEALHSVVSEVELLTVELSQKLVENELLGHEISLADVEKQQQQQQYRRPAQPIRQKRSPISPSRSNEEYNTSSFEEDLHTESRITRSEEEEEEEQPFARRETTMGGTGRFTIAAFEHQKLPRPRTASSSSTSTVSTPSPKGIIMKPIVAVKKPTPTYENNQYSDQDFESSISSKSKERQRPHSARRQSSEEEGDLLLSTKTGEKIYSTDFEDSRSKLRNLSRNDVEEEDDDDVADTMRLSARSINTLQRSSSDSDDS